MRPVIMALTVAMSLACSSQTAPDLSSAPPAADTPVEPPSNTQPPAEPEDLPAPLEMSESYGTNMHTGFGAQGDHTTSRVRIEFVTEADVVVHDEGKHREYVMYNKRGTDEDEWSWSDRWSGTWRARDESMTLEVALVQNECTRMVAKYGQAKQADTCRTVDRTATIECTRATIDVDEHPTDVWECRADNARFAQTTTPWMFGLASCIERTRGSRGRGISYRPCTTDD
jgi:hypothetical protein